MEPAGKKEPAEKRILVLSDSALSSLGCSFDNAIDLFARRVSWDAPVEFVNPSVAGMTSVDAAAHYNDLARSQRFDAVILYLGNSDACGFGYLKSARAFPGSGLLARLRTAAEHKRTPLSKRAVPFELTPFPLRAKEPGRRVPPAECLKAVGRIARSASKAGARVILVEPVSKMDFPPCGNTGNFIFFKILGVSDSHPYRGGAGADPADALLIEAVASHSAGMHEKALELYVELLDRGRLGERGIIAANNTAAILFERGQQEEALEALDEIPLGENPLRPIVLFNRAVASLFMGRSGDAKRLFTEAAEADTGTYRVTPSYREALREPGTFAGIKIQRIDLSPILAPGDFIDYCHPTCAGHEKLFAALRPAVEKALGLGPGDHAPGVLCNPLNPDRAAGFKTPFFEYFGITGGRAGGADAAIREHPLFGDPSFASASPPGSPADRGRLPELYFLRHMAEIYRETRGAGRLSRILERSALLVPDPEKMAAWWPALGGAAPIVPACRLEEIRRALDSRSVLERALSLLKRTILDEPAAFDRYRTITYWFFREALLFGPVSHWTMFIDRRSLRNVVDSCLFILFHGPGDSRGDLPAFRILKAADSLMESHEEFLSPYAHRLYSVPGGWFAKYRSRMLAIAESREMKELGHLLERMPPM